MFSLIHSVERMFKVITPPLNSDSPTNVFHSRKLFVRADGEYIFLMGELFLQIKKIPHADVIHRSSTDYFRFTIETISLTEIFLTALFLQKLSN